MLGTLFTPGDATLNSANTNRDEHSTEFYLRDTTQWTSRFSTWLGLRHTRIDRSEIGTDGTGATSYAQSFTTPWVAASYAFLPGQIAYASYGQGIESSVAPALPQYANAGASMPSIKSHQFEFGVKGASDRFDWTAAYFDIVRPISGDVGTCDAGTAGSCVLALDGTDKHRGVEASLGYDGPVWGWRGGAQALHARREGSADPSINGLRPVNVPALTIKLQARYSVAQLPGMSVLAAMSYDSNRIAIVDNSVKIPSVTRFDLGLRYVQNTPSAKFTWRAGLDKRLRQASLARVPLAIRPRVPLPTRPPHLPHLSSSGPLS